MPALLQVAVAAREAVLEGMLAGLEPAALQLLDNIQDTGTCGTCGA